MRIGWLILLLSAQISKGQIQSVLAYPGTDRYLGFTKWQAGYLILNEHQKPRFIMLPRGSLFYALRHKDAALKSLPEGPVLSEAAVRQVLVNYDVEVMRGTP